MSIIIKQVSEPLPNPRQYISDLPENVEKILAKSLAKSPDERYLTALEFAEELERVQAKSVRTLQSLRVKTLKRLGDAPKTVSILLVDDEATVDQLEDNEIEEPKVKKSSRKPVTNQTGVTTALSRTVFIVIEDGIPFYTSFPDARWHIWLEYGEEVAIIEPLKDARDRMWKQGHYIEVTDKHGNVGFVPARSISFENPLNRKKWSLSDMVNRIGQSLSRYHILEQLGEGGMATVYKACDTHLESDVAVKVIRTENLALSILERSLKRFEREAKSLAKLTHANIVNILDYGEYKSQCSHRYLCEPALDLLALF